MCKYENSQCRLTTFSYFHNSIFSQFHNFTLAWFHDRFLVIDKTTLIHGMRRRNALRFGGKICRRQTRRAPKRPRASLNHLGKKCFAFSSLDKSNIPDILAKL